MLRPGSGLTPRRALVLFRQLPVGSATVAALRGGSEFRGWDKDRYLVADLIDAVNEQTWVFISANTPKGQRKPNPPEPVERPDRAAHRKADPNSFANIAKQKLAAKRQQKQETADGGQSRG